MIPVLSAAAIRQWDLYTIEHEPISSYDLMERAVSRLAEYISRHYPSPGPSCIIICGPGNNGGDGLGLARHLYNLFYEVHVVLVGEGKTPDCIKNKQRLSYCPGIQITQWPEKPILIRKDTLIIDAMLGSGFSGTLLPPYPEVIDYFSEHQGLKIAIDLPTGTPADKVASGKSFRANYTLTFQTPKTCFFLGENAPFIGEWMVLDIGLHPGFLKDVAINSHLIAEYDITQRIKVRDRYAHKGTFGHALLINGAQGKMGAAILAGEACLRAGAGKLTMHIPSRSCNIIQTALPEGMVSLDPHLSCWSETPNLGGYQAIGVGCGIGTNPLTSVALNDLLMKAKVPMVLDADSINLLAQSPEYQSLIPPGSILTPHPGEFHRLVGDASNSLEDLGRLQKFCITHKVIMVLKGAYTRICLPDGHLYFNPTGNPGMATAGSGDVLTGILTGLLAQGYPSEDAALIGVYLHGLAGDFALASTGSVESIIARDIIRNLGKAFSHIITSPDHGQT